MSTGRCPSTGRCSSLSSFCPQCGTPAAGTPADGWLFCTRCGSSLTAPRGKPSILPWAVTAAAFVALFALLVANGFSQRAATPAPENAMLQAGVEFDPSQMPVRASTDISQLSPEERADRLFNRVMQLSTEGKTDSVRFFAPMGIIAYQMIGKLNADQRYDLGRIAEVSGALPLARAQADSILREQPSHLLGLVLAARVATLERNTAELRRIEARLLSVERAELVRALPEYQRHEAEIMSALAQARRGTR